jgi:outer membrane protein assembly complex protein YaeT
LAALAGLCQAQVGNLAGRSIRSVTYVPEAVLQAEDLTRVEVLKPGNTLRAEDVAEAIDRLFATGLFEDIAVEAEASGDGAAIRIRTEPTRFISGFRIAGSISQPPNRGEVTSSSQLQLGARFRQEDVDAAVKRINGLFDENGLYEAEVRAEVESVPSAEQVFVTFHVKKGKRAKYEAPIVHGETELSEGAILRATGWRIPLIHWWRHVTAERTQNGIQGIRQKYQKNDRLTTRVELEELRFDQQRRRVRPSLSITPGPKIRVKAVEAKVSQRILKRYVPVFQERAVDNDLLVEGARNLRDYFQSQGYYDVDVTFRTQPVVNDEEEIQYVISLGTRFRLVKLSVAGNKYFDEETIRERMFMSPASLLSRRGRYSEAFRKKDEENVGNLYRSNGFRDVKVTSVATRGEGADPSKVSLVLNIDEGPQWTVESVVLDGVADEERRKAFEERLACLPGQPFSESNMAADRATILTWYFSNGYPRAELRAGWQKAATPNTARVVYTVTVGPRHFVRGIYTTGLKTTSPKLVAKRISLKPGEPLSSTDLQSIQRTFYDMGVFARVDSAIENLGGDTRYKYAVYNFEEANRYTLALGLGAQLGRFGTPNSTSVASPGGTTGFSPLVSLNVTRLNFRGLGHTVTLQGAYSNLQKRGSLSYLAPRFHNIEGRNLTLALLFDNTLNVRTFGSRRLEASVQVSQKLSKATTVLGRLAFRRVSVSDVVIPTLLVPQFLQPVRIGMFSVNLAQDRRNDPTNTVRGIYNTADVGIATKILGSERNFVRILLRNATYHQVKRNLIFARQTQVGWITPYSAPANLTEAQSVPLPERFFGGGPDSLRAVPYNQAGPRDTGAPVIPGGPSSAPTGFPLGGNALLFNNLELRFPLLGANIGGVLFHDMGNVYRTISDVSFRFRQRDINDFSYMYHAVGFGVRYRTPIGPVRVDLAYSMNPPSYLGFNGTPTELLQCGPNRPDLPPACQPTRLKINGFQFFFSIGQTF